MNKYVVIDTETTGLDFNKHEVIGFGGIVLIDGVIVETIEVLIHPARIEQADPKALEVNGYTPKKWRDAIPAKVALEMIGEFLIRHSDGTLVGHNVNFDIQFLKRFGASWRGGFGYRFPKPYLDTRDLCRAVLSPFGLHSMSLDNICAFLGWERRRAHSALSDCEDCIRLIQNLCPPSPRFLARLHTMKAIRKIKGVIK